ncbi:MAG TPA: rRNA adenine N-6-methyltransferase family protein [Rhizomicrobium sp.]|jgi:phosphatidylethanolamine/phosphatidyl-N-methylethanolamine N-methyltransferase|nr:rRNA adenine N-6-methyltransferase family protein [Rhizomicrobium sp.]
MPNATARSPLDELRFWRSLVTRPRAIGAIAPSSPALARKIAGQIDPAVPGTVLELGPGTGVVTDALIARGIPVERLIAIEADRDLAKLMRERFPGLRVVEGDAFDLDRTLPREASSALAAVVSGLPLLNFPPARRRALIGSALARMPAGAPFVQFSYGFAAPVPADRDISVRLAGLVLANLPPARIWLYHRAE